MSFLLIIIIYFHSKLSIKFIILELLVEIMKKKESRVQQQQLTTN